tara:strand:+ start:15047 stop:15343 length:297 start_codon:yes stop_codon:yes gene_type:complete
MILVNFIQQLPSVPQVDNVNNLLSYLLGVLVLVIGYLYREKAKETKDLNNRIKEVYESHKDDLKFFSEEKTKSVVEVTTALNKVIMLLDQLKNISSGR